ncbi:MAG: 1-phosphofructokinase family hexose kinase [Bryobacteraceae bacterium]|nr:1-phosphofructokinase family hexose kinase [Bryobacteraceae bacterium]
MKSLIVTLTVNPAIERTVTVDRLVFEDRGYILSQAEQPGGRGLSAARVIHSFGGKVTAVVTSGGGVGEQIEDMLTGLGFKSRVVKIRNQNRTNFTISDRQGLTVKLNELGPPIEREELEALRRVIAEVLEKSAWLMICGSLPPGVDPYFYARLIEMCHSAGVQTLVDTDGDPLLHALEAKPTAIAPNQHEAERLLSRALITRSQTMEALQRLHGMGPNTVLLSLGSRGAIATNGEEQIEAVPPRVEALCPIGAGDALSAAYVWARRKGKNFSDALRWGVAAGTASAALPGITFADLAQTKAVYKGVQVRPLR